MIRDMEAAKESVPTGISSPGEWNGVTKHFVQDGDHISAAVAGQPFSASVLIQNKSPYLLVCDTLDDSTFWQGYGGSLTYSRCIRPYSEVVNFGAWANAATGTDDGNPLPFATCFRLSIWKLLGEPTQKALYMGKTDWHASKWSEEEQKSLSAFAEKDRGHLHKWLDTHVSMRKVDGAPELQKWLWRVPKVGPKEAPLAGQIGCIFIWVEGPTKLKKNDKDAQPTYQALTYICDGDDAKRATDLLAKSVKRHPADITAVRELFAHYSWEDGSSPTQAFTNNASTELEGEQSVLVAEPVSKENPAPNLKVTLFPRNVDE
jgi:hypothetical protein